MYPNETARAATKPESWRDVLPVHPAADMFPRMSETELAELAEDIKGNGLQMPVILWTDPTSRAVYLVDGRNRLDAMESIGFQILFCPHKRMIEASGDGAGLVPHKYTSEDPYAIAISANLKRRHLTADQKNNVIAAVLKAQPHTSNRQIAKSLDVDHHKVGNVRREMESTGEIAPVEKTVGKDGKARRRSTIAERRQRREQRKGSSPGFDRAYEIADELGLQLEGCGIEGGYNLNEEGKTTYFANLVDLTPHLKQRRTALSIASGNDVDNDASAETAKAQHSAADADTAPSIVTEPEPDDELIDLDIDAIAVSAWIDESLKKDSRASHITGRRLPQWPATSITWMSRESAGWPRFLKTSPARSLAPSGFEHQEDQ